MRPEDETKDERLPVAVPATIKAWVRDRSRVKGLTSSEYVFDLIVRDLYTQEGIRTPSDGIPKPEVIADAVKTAVVAALGQIGMVTARGSVERKRKMA